MLVALLTLLGLMLRAATAGRGGLWCDEAQFLWIVRMPKLQTMLDFLWHHESHPPLFYLLMRAWLGVFGDSEAAALALPVILGVILIPVAYRVGDHVFSHRTGLIAATLVTVSPPLTRYSGMVRPYALLPLLCLLSVYWLWCGLKGPGTRSWVAYVIVTLAMLLTHNWAWMVLAAEWMIVAGQWTLYRERVGSSIVRSWALAQLVILVGYAPWLLSLLYQSQHAGYDAFPLEPVAVLVDLAETVISLPASVAVPLCILLIAAAAWRAALRHTAVLPSEKGPQLSLSLFIGTPALAFGVATILSLRRLLLFPQCMTTIIPCLLIAIAYGIVSLSRIPRVVTAVFTLIYLVFTLDSLRDIKSNAREVAALVASRAQPTDLVMITPVWHASPFNYYYTLDNPQSNYPHDERRGAIDYDDLRARLLDPRSMARARQRLVEAHRTGRRVWLVTEPINQKSDVPDGDNLPSTFRLPAYAQVGRVRAGQLRKQLGDLYGPPSTFTVPMLGRDGLEILQVLLYARQPDGDRDAVH
jgi:uncharacterized membrane protein